jgi:hypothetical protein
VVSKDVQRGPQLLQYDRLGLYAVPLLEPSIAHLDRHDSGRAVMLRQNRLEHLRADRVSAPSDLEGKLRSKRANTLRAGTLPLRPPSQRCDVPNASAPFNKRLSSCVGSGTLAKYCNDAKPLCVHARPRASSSA